MCKENALTPYDWLALSMVPKLGCHRIHRLFRMALQWPDEWYSHLSRDQTHYLNYLLSDNSVRVQLNSQLAWCSAERQRYLLCPDHPMWPSILNEIHDPPVLVWAWGNLDTLRAPGIAIVGSRKASRKGCQRATEFAGVLASGAFCIVSGMAMGIDAAAHQGALQAKGATIAVLGCGIDILYPARNAGLREQILNNGGLLLSEFSPGTAAHPRFFPRRNRIITGLTRGILVVEAALRSGSLVSARLALEQNRDVFALPGDPENQGMAGCLWLIQQGAMLVTQPQDILQSLNTDSILEASAIVECPAPSSSHVKPDSESSQLPDLCESVSDLLSALSCEPASLDYLLAVTHLAYHDCITELQLLELSGHVKRVLGGWVKQ